MAIWDGTGAIETRLLAIRLLHLVPVACLVLLFIWHLRPRTVLDASMAAVSVAVLVGSPGLRDNLELPLAYTAVGMPLALGVWILLNREPRAWHTLAILVACVVAVGFKEQGLVVVPVAIVAWWMRAPGARRPLVLTLVALTVVYILARLHWRSQGLLFEQSLGYGFGALDPRSVEHTVGFPYWVFAYNSLCTVLNILFAEPTRGTFSITNDLMNGQSQHWEVVHLVSSTLLTATILWWGVQRLRREVSPDWSVESRTFVAMLVSIAACGALSFDYSRDRLGGMAVPFYALAAYFALRDLASRASHTTGWRVPTVGLLLVTVASLWQVRAVGTLEQARRTSWRNQTEWLTDVPKRRVEFKDRAAYREILESMVRQGVRPGAPEETPYPEWLARTLLPPP